MTQNPDPGNTTGLEPGGGVPPGETPPIADSMSQSANTENDKQRYPRSANIGAIVAIAVIALLMGGFILAMLIDRIDL